MLCPIQNSEKSKDEAPFIRLVDPVALTIPMLSVSQCIFPSLNTSSQAPIFDDPDLPVTAAMKRVKKQIPPLPEVGGHSYLEDHCLRCVSCLVRNTDDNPHVRNRCSNHWNPLKKSATTPLKRLSLQIQYIQSSTSWTRWTRPDSVEHVMRAVSNEPGLVSRTFKYRVLISKHTHWPTPRKYTTPRIYPLTWPDWSQSSTSLLKKTNQVNYGTSLIAWGTELLLIL